MCFSRGICVQYGGFPRMKHVFSAAMPVACTVGLKERKFIFLPTFSLPSSSSLLKVPKDFSTTDLSTKSVVKSEREIAQNLSVDVLVVFHFFSRTYSTHYHTGIFQPLACRGR